MSQLDDLVKETRAAFIIAKADGVLDAGEVIQLAATLAQKIHKLAGLSGAEKKSLLLHTLKRGLDDDGGVDNLAGMVGASTEVKEAFKTHLLQAAGAATDLMLDAAQGKLNFAALRDWRSWLPSCIGFAQTVLAAKDQKLIAEAKAFAEKILPAEAVTVVEKVVADSAAVVDLPGVVKAAAV
jgi:hypothetical protein